MEIKSFINVHLFKTFILQMKDWAEAGRGERWVGVQEKFIGRSCGRYVLVRGYP